MHITELSFNYAHIGHAFIQSCFSLNKPSFKWDHSVIMQLSKLCTYPICI